MPRPRIRPGPYVDKAPRALPQEAPELIERHRRDWFRILAELQDVGYTATRVARTLRLAPTTVRNWKYGIEPTHARGEALLELHAIARRRGTRRRGGRASPARVAATAGAGQVAAAAGAGETA